MTTYKTPTAIPDIWAGEELTSQKNNKITTLGASLTISRSDTSLSGYAPFKVEGKWACDDEEDLLTLTWGAIDDAGSEAGDLEMTATVFEPATSLHFADGDDEEDLLSISLAELDDISVWGDLDTTATASGPETSIRFTGGDDEEDLLSISLAELDDVSDMGDLDMSWQFAIGEEETAGALEGWASEHETGWDVLEGWGLDEAIDEAKARPQNWVMVPSTADKRKWMKTARWASTLITAEYEVRDFEWVAPDDGAIERLLARAEINYDEYELEKAAEKAARSVS